MQMKRKLQCFKLSKRDLHNIHLSHNSPSSHSSHRIMVMSAGRETIYSNDQCYFCGLIGHRKNDCPDFKHLQAMQRRQRHEERKQMQRSAFRHHHHQMQGLQVGNSPQTWYAPMQMRPMANAVGYPQSQIGGGARSQIIQPTIIQPSYLQ
jgi:hypothetical protein